MSKNNSYQKTARRRDLTGITLSKGKNFFAQVDSVASQRLASQGKWGSSALEVFKDFGIGVLGGAFLAKITSPASFFVGLPISFLGYGLGSRSLTALGLGTMSYGVVKTMGVDGTQKQTFKEKMSELGQEFKTRLFLDRLKSKKTETSTSSSTPTNGLGKVRYFTYPETDSQTAGPGELDMSALEKIEQQITESAQQYQNTQMTGTMAGLNEMLEAPIY